MQRMKSNWNLSLYVKVQKYFFEGGIPCCGGSDK